MGQETRRKDTDATPPSPLPYEDDDTSYDPLDETLCGKCYRPASECDCPISVQATPISSK